jgi:signal transduction histidine kinase
MMPGDPRTPELVAESVALAEQASKEVRNLSHLLHPPSLDKVGLNTAIRWHSKQVSEVAGIHVSVDLPAEFQRLPEEIETALFRIFQESLENVRRHSGSPIAKVRLIQRKERVVMEVEDQGHGVPSGLLTNADRNVAGLGVGVVGMRERVRQLGGLLEIESGGKGTIVRAIIPIPSDGASRAHGSSELAALAL